MSFQRKCKSIPIHDIYKGLDDLSAKWGSNYFSGSPQNWGPVFTHSESPLQDMPWTS